MIHQAEPQTKTSGFRIVPVVALLTAGAIGLGFGICQVGPGNFRMHVEKALTHLCLPFGLLWLTLSAVLLWSYVWRESPESVALIRLRRLLAVIWIAMYLIGNGAIAKRATRQLDSDYCQINLNDIQPLDAVVVLGGGMATRPDGNPQLDFGGDRVVMAARLYHTNRVKKIVCTGSLLPGLDRTGANQSQLAIDLLEQIAVPPEVMLAIGGRNTTEEMAILGEMFDAEDRVGLITSGWHLKRALRLAANENFFPVPIPADFRAPPDLAPTILDMIPTSDAAETNAVTAKEWLAWFVGR